MTIQKTINRNHDDLVALVVLTIELIRGSASAAVARVALMERRWEANSLFELLEKVGSDACRPEGLSEDFGFTDNLYRLTEEQAQAILEIRLHRLTAMEQNKLMEDYQGVLDEIEDLLDILDSNERLQSVIRYELIYGSLQTSPTRPSSTRSSPTCASSASQRIGCHRSGTD